MVTTRLVEETLVKVRRIPALGANHHASHIGEAGLQRHNHQITHQADVFAARQMRISRLLKLYLLDFILHVLESVHLHFDGTDRFKIFVKFLLI